LSLWIWIPLSKAAVTLQSFTPPVTVQGEEDTEWKAASVSMQLSAGDTIATGQGASADLVFEDGSTLHLEADTQLAIRDLEYSAVREVRVSRLKLFLGKIFGKATPLEYETNVFEVETQTAVAGFKFSAATIETQPAGSSCGSTPGPCSTLSDFEGLVDVTSTDTGTIVILRPAGDLGAAVTFTLPPGTTVNTQTDPTTGRVSFTSSGQLTQATVSLSSQHNTVTIGNAPGNPSLALTAGGYGVNMEPNSSATIGFSQSDADRQVLGINLGIGTFSFDFGQDAAMMPGCMFVSPTSGQTFVDGILLTDRGFFSLPGTDGTCGPEEIRESPPEPGKDEPAGVAAAPPTPTPTPRPLPIPDEDEDEPTASPILR
jgi:hypothetical protein